MNARNVTHKTRRRSHTVMPTSQRDALGFRSRSNNKTQKGRRHIVVEAQQQQKQHLNRIGPLSRMSNWICSRFIIMCGSIYGVCMWAYKYTTCMYILYYIHLRNARA